MLRELDGLLLGLLLVDCACGLQIWHRILFPTSEIPPTCQLRTIIKARHTVIGVPLGRMEATTDLSGQEIAEAFWNSDESDFTLSSMSGNK